MSETGAAPAAAPAAPSAPSEGAAPEAVEPNGSAAAKPTNGNGAPKPAAAAPESHDVKIDGEVHKVSAAQVRRALGMADDEPIGPRELRALSAEVASRRRFEAAAKSKREADELTALGSRDPIAALVKMYGGDEAKAENALMDYLGKRIEDRALPADQREQRDRQRQLEERAARADQLEQEQQRQQASARVEQITQNATAQFTGALKTAGLPASPATLARMAALVEASLDGGRQFASADEVAIAVRDEFEAEAAAYVAALPADALAKLLGKRRNELRAADAAELKTTLGTRPRKQDGTFVKPPTTEEPKSTRKAMQELREKFGMKR